MITYSEDIYRFLIYWLREIHQTVLYGRENEESVCLASFNMWFRG